MHQRLESSLQGSFPDIPPQNRYEPEPGGISAHPPNAEKRFSHRLNHDSTFDSICRFCFSTIATRLREADLDQPEEEHVCDPLVLARFQGTQA